ncbi:hypothetical protein CsatB_014985 [Cannabis sativa]
MNDYDDRSVMIKKSYFEVLGLCCASEVSLIEKIVRALNGVKHISVIVPTKTLIVFHDSLLLSDSQIVNKPRIYIKRETKGLVSHAKTHEGNSGH